MAASPRLLMIGNFLPLFLKVLKTLTLKIGNFLLLSQGCPAPPPVAQRGRLPSSYLPSLGRYTDLQPRHVFVRAAGRAGSGGDEVHGGGEPDGDVPPDQGRAAGNKEEDQGDRCARFHSHVVAGWHWENLTVAYM